MTSTKREQQHHHTVRVSSLEAGGICDNLFKMSAYSEHQNDTDTMRNLQARAIYDNLFIKPTYREHEHNHKGTVRILQTGGIHDN
jgi:hypothetical protein